jgi:hypothetical protein
MELPSNEVYKILKKKGVTEVYHANSTITSCQFLESGALLSRGSIVRRGLLQTAQKSDDLDQKLGVWFDVFVDSVDIHARTKNVNIYGPVLFVLDVSSLSKVDSGMVWVTKLNPTKWAGKTHAERWFTSIADLSDNFIKGQFDQMLVFRNCGGELPIKDCIKEIILDDPEITQKNTNINYYSMAFGALRLAISRGSLEKIHVLKRICTDQCGCVATYQSDIKVKTAMYALRLY